MSAALARFAEEKYLSLETYRKSGKAVPTPVWFVERDGVLFASAPAHTGKVKRLRNSPRARVAPCDQRGAAKGEWLDAQAHIVGGDEAAEADRLLARKYGFQRKMLDLWGKLKRWDYAIIAIRV